MSNSDEDIINFYENNEVKRFIPNYNNPSYNFETMPLKHPMRVLICGASGGGKSNICLNIIKSMNNTFEKIIIFTQNKQEPLYEYLEDKIDYPELEIFEGIESVNSYDFDNLEQCQTLIIFDDMVVEKKQQKICDLFIRGRKMAGGMGISLMYLTQSYYQTPIIIRKQLTQIIIRKINGKRDLDSILRECSMDCDKEQLKRLYEYACPEDDIKKFLLIDLNAPKKYRFRLGFKKVLNIHDF